MNSDLVKVQAVADQAHAVVRDGLAACSTDELNQLRTIAELVLHLPFASARLAAQILLVSSGDERMRRCVDNAV